MNCPACGTDNRQGAHFCRMCGKRLSEISTGTEPTAPQAPVAAVEGPEPIAEATAAAGVTPEPAIEGGEFLPEAKTGQETASAQGDARETAESKPETAAEIQPMADWSTSEPGAAELNESPVEAQPKPEAAEEKKPLPGTKDALPEAVAPDSETVAGDHAQEPEDADDTATADAAIQPEELLSQAVAEHEAKGLKDQAGDEEDEATAEVIAPEEAVAEVGTGAMDLAGDREGLTLVVPGTVIAGRYLVVEALEVEKNEILYRAEDLHRCWQCGFEGNVPDDDFCAQCGVSLARRPEVRLLQVREAESEPATDVGIEARMVDESRPFLLLARPEPELEATPAPGSIRLIVGQRSDTGRVRELNEDSTLVLTLAPTYESQQGWVVGLFAVADGMGGHEGGEVASRMALQVLADKVLHGIVLPGLAGEGMPPDVLLDHLRQATIAANDAVFLARRKRDNDMGTTLTTAWIENRELFLAHVGDCRAYRWNAEGLRQLTADHSLVASMIASGQAEPDEIYSHPHRSVIYRCIGDQPVVDVDTARLPLDTGDRIILCSDGLWEMIRNEGIEEVMMREADPQAACDLLVNHANLAGGEDNISVIVVQVEAL